MDLGNPHFGKLQIAECNDCGRCVRKIESTK
jgi:hypothetical protein